MWDAAFERYIHFLREGKKQTALASESLEDSGGFPLAFDVQSPQVCICKHVLLLDFWLTLVLCSWEVCGDWYVS